MKPKKYALLLFFLLIALCSKAQCPYKNTALKSGEFLSYNLYYNWKFVFVKAGTASMSTVMSRYRGQNAWRTSLTTRGNGKVDNMFVLRDTLLSYSTEDLVPLYFRKGAREGKRYTVDEIWYNYSKRGISLTQQRKHTDGRLDKKQRTAKTCVYDMMNMFQRARSFNTSSWPKGKIITFPIADGNGTETAQLKYIGKKQIKADNQKKYNCLELSYMEKDGGKYKEVVRFFVTDDSKHIPVRLDMSLKFGSAKAYLATMRGI